VNAAALDAKKGSKKIKPMSTADHRGSGSGKSELRGELKKCEGKSVKDLGY